MTKTVCSYLVWDIKQYVQFMNDNADVNVILLHFKKFFFHTADLLYSHSNLLFWKCPDTAVST